jgi:signal peptidase I
VAYFFFSAWRGLRAQGGVGRPVAAAGWLSVSVAYAAAVWMAGGIFPIPTASMAGTLLEGDKISVHALARPPEHGQIVVFRYPEDRRQVFAMRVAGIPGDRIRIENRKLVRNGVPVDEPYVSAAEGEALPYRDFFPVAATGLGISESGRKMLSEHARDGEIVVPPDRYFVLGDNRGQANDSRHWGFVPAGDVLGAPGRILWSDSAQPADTPFALYAKARWSRIGRQVR